LKRRYCIYKKYTDKNSNKKIEKKFLNETKSLGRVLVIVFLSNFFFGCFGFQFQCFRHRPWKFPTFINFRLSRAIWSKHQKCQNTKHFKRQKQQKRGKKHNRSLFSPSEISKKIIVYRLVNYFTILIFLRFNFNYPLRLVKSDNFCIKQVKWTKVYKI